MITVSGTQAFEQLAGFLSSRAGDQATLWLEQKGVPKVVAQMIGSAITDPRTVSLPDDTTVPLGPVIAPFLPDGVTLPSALVGATLTSLSFSVPSAGGALSFAGAMTLPLQLAKKSTTLDLSLSLSSTGGVEQSITGQLTGVLPLGEQQLSAVLNLAPQPAGQAATLHCTWKSTDSGTISPSTLCDAFGLQAPTFISGLPDVGLTEVDFDLDLAAAGDKKLQISAAYKDGEAFVVVDRIMKDATGGSVPADQATDDTAGEWVLVLGAQLADDLGAWPIVGKELKVLDLPLAGGGLLLVSTANYNKLEIPTFGEEATPFGPFPVNVTDRFMAIGVLDLGKATGAAAGHLAAIDSARDDDSNAPKGQILVTAALPTAALTATLGERNVFGCFPLVDLELTIGATSPFFTLAGNVTLKLGPKDAANTPELTFTAALNITDDEVTGRMDMKDSVPFALPGISGVPSVNLSELGGLIGVNFDKQEVIAGLMARFGFGSTQASGSPPTADGFSAMLPKADGTGGSGKPVRTAPDECAIVLGINDDAVVLPVPDLDLLLLSIADADLIAVLGTVVPGVSTSELEGVLGDIKVSNLLLYWCDSAPHGLVLPDGTATEPGFRFHGGLDVWGMQAWAALDVTTAGFTGDATMSTVVFGQVLTLAGTGNVAPGSDAAAAGVTSGGPLLHVSTVASPYLDATWDVRLFGKAGTTGNVVIAKNQFTFDVTADLPGVTGAFACEITQSWKHLSAAFTMRVQGTINLPLVGASLPIVLDDDIALTLTMDLTDGVHLTVSGTFQFQDATLTIPPLSLDASFGDLEQLPAQLISHIQTEATAIFAQGYQEAEHIIVTFGDDVGKFGADALNYLKGLADDVRSVVIALLGSHKAHNPPWLRDNAIVRGGNTSTVEWAVIQHSTRRAIPDLDTFNQLSAGQTVTDVGPLLSSIPLDSVQMPSRKNGTVVTHRGDSAQFLIVNDQDKNGNPVGARYQLQNPAAFQQAISTATHPPIYQQGLPCTADDIENIPVHQELKQAPCCIGVQGAPELDVFMNDMRYHIPDPTTKQLLASTFNTTYWLRQEAWDAIPIGEDLPTLKLGSVVKNTDDPTVYVVEADNKLHAFGSYDSFRLWGYHDEDIIKTTLKVKDIFNIGSEAAKTPK